MQLFDYIVNNIINGGANYNASKLYDMANSAGPTAWPISRALDAGINQNVQAAIAQYIQDYGPKDTVKALQTFGLFLCINSINWIPEEYV